MKKKILVKSQPKWEMHFALMGLNFSFKRLLNIVFSYKEIKMCCSYPNMFALHVENNK